LGRSRHIEFEWNQQAIFDRDDLRQAGIQLTADEESAAFKRASAGL